MGLGWDVMLWGGMGCGVVWYVMGWGVRICSWGLWDFFLLLACLLPWVRYGMVGMVGVVVGMSCFCFLSSPSPFFSVEVGLDMEIPLPSFCHFFKMVSGVRVGGVISTCLGR